MEWSVPNWSDRNGPLARICPQGTDTSSSEPLGTEQTLSVLSRLLDIVSAYGKGYVVWQEVFDNKVKVSLEQRRGAPLRASVCSPILSLLLHGYRALSPECACQSLHLSSLTVN